MIFSFQTFICIKKQKFGQILFQTKLNKSKNK